MSQFLLITVRSKSFSIPAVSFHKDELSTNQYQYLYENHKKWVSEPVPKIPSTVPIRTGKYRY
ncbi:hypothetical protein Hanom_Chr14g01246841 [Helianthus anomalus]